MAATNIFYRIPSQRGTRVATLAGSECTLERFCDYIIESEGLNRNDFIIASGTKVLRPNSCRLQLISLQNNSHVDILIPLLGGKGGFGSLLRAIGAQIEKTTNRDACRDLSGRRLRDVKREEQLRKLIALRDKLEEEKKRRKREKLEQLKKKNEESASSKSIQELVAMFDDHAYNRRRLEIGDILEAAVDKGLINYKKRQLAQDSEKTQDDKAKKIKTSESSQVKDEFLVKKNTEKEDSKGPSISKNSGDEEPEKLGIKKRDLWLGLDDEGI